MDYSTVIQNMAQPLCQGQKGSKKQGDVAHKLRLSAEELRSL